MATATEVSVPDLGDFADVPVIEIHVAPGDVVHNEDPLVTLESDKATMDVPSPAAGTVRELRVKVGDLVSRGSPILLLDTEGAAVEPPPLTDQQEPPALDAADPVAAAREPAARSASAAVAERGRGGSGRRPAGDRTRGGIPRDRLRGLRRGARQPWGAAAGPRAGPGPDHAVRDGAEGADHQGGRDRGRPRPGPGGRGGSRGSPPRGRASRRYRPRTSRSSGRSRSGR